LKRAGRKEGIIDLPFEAIEKILDQGIRDIQLCGNRGEAIFHPRINDIIDLIKSSGSRFEMNTNGGRFDTNWWYNLGQKMTDGDQVIFAIDGLKTSHEFYRNTKWMDVIKNMRSFIDGGGDAIWQMVLFRHNEKEVNLIKKLSKEIGCIHTWIINSRVYNNKYKKPIKEFNKTKEDILLTEGFSNPENIDCRFGKGKRVYIGIDGSVWPCCFSRCHYGFKERAYKGNRVTEAYKDEYDFVNVMNTPLDKIVKESKLFKTMFGNMYNTNGIGFDPEHDYMISRDTDKPIIYKNPNKDAMARHPRYMVNFPCQVYCNTTIDGRNRRDIENV
jgi:hypothetical protein